MKPINKTKLQIFANIGVALEYYDYIIFAYLIPIFSSVFFPEDTPLAKDIEMILLFSISSISKISGGLILGFLGARYGKSFVMILSIYLMAISTFAIGLLPSYQTIGIIAPILLLLCRFIQGLAYSAELPSASMFVFDYSEHNYGKSIGILIASTTLGAVAATFVMYLLNEFCSQVDILSYIWRIPFLLGGIVGIFGIYIRSSLAKQINYNICNIAQFWALVKQSRLQIFDALVTLAAPASLIVIYIYIDQFFIGYFSYTKSQIYLISTIGLIFSIACGIICGFMLDKYRNNYIKYCYYLFFILYPLIWFGLFYESFAALLVFAIIFQFFTTNFMVFALYRMNITINNNIKSIVIIIVYNLVFILCGFIPMLAKNYGSLNIAICLPYLLGALSMIRFLITNK